MGKPFTPERLANTRRMRKARRTFKQQPLFAYQILCESDTRYSYQQFLDDLRYRKPPKRRKGKSNLHRYGRYSRMMSYIDSYRRTGNADDALRAMRLRQHITQPYRVLVCIRDKKCEYRFSPLIQISRIEELVSRLGTCRTETEADTVIQEFDRTSNIY